MERDELIVIATALYGDRWKTEIGRDLGVSRRTVHRWVNGEHNIAPTVRDALIEICGQRLKAIASVMPTAAR